MIKTTILAAPVLAIAAASLIAGCAGLGPEGCAHTDWYRQGYTDGSREWYMLLDQHEKRCAPAGVKPDPVQYKKGFDDARWDQEHRFK